jgi:hypothetical protein
VISQAPLTFVVVCVVSLSISYVFMRWQFRDTLENKNLLIASLREKSEEIPEGRLSAIAEEDRKGIDRVIRVMEYRVGNAGLSLPEEPYLNFQFHVFNGSIFEISLDRRVEGYVMFAGRPFRGNLEMLASDQNVQNLKHGQTGTFGLRLWLTRSSADLLLADQGNLSFNFDFLIVTVLGEGIAPKPLSFDTLRSR